MAGQPILAGSAFSAGILAQANGTYRRMYETVTNRLSGCMQIDIPSTRRQEIFHYFESAPYLARWPIGTGMEAGSFKGVRYTALNHRWAKNIEWNFDDAQDDQTNSLLTQARQIGTNAAMLDERVFFQILLGGSDADLLPSVPNAPDGVAIYNDDARFGLADGNTADGEVDSGNIIRSKYWSALSAFKRMQDTQGQPLHDETVIDGPKLLIYDATDELAFQEAFIQNQVAGVAITNTQPTGSTEIAGVSNVAQDANQVPTIWSTQRISDNSYYVFLENSLIKPVFSMLREPLREQIATFDNSDVARDKGIESVRFWLRKGFGVNLPYSTFRFETPS